MLLPCELCRRFAVLGCPEPRIREEVALCGMRPAADSSSLPAVSFHILSSRPLEDRSQPPLPSSLAGCTMAVKKKCEFQWHQ